MKNFSYEMVLFHINKAVADGPNGDFQAMARKVYEAIHMEGRYLTDRERQSLRYLYHNYLDNEMFSNDVEYVCIDSNGRLYPSSQSVPKHVFYRTGYRWKTSKKMLYENPWLMFDGKHLTSIQPEDFRPAFYNCN